MNQKDKMRIWKAIKELWDEVKNLHESDVHILEIIYERELDENKKKK